MENRMGSVVYVSSNLISKYSADIVCIMEMCSAFTKNKFNTMLCVPKFNLSKEFLFEYYGVEYPFKIIEVDVPEVLVRRTIPGRGAIFSFIASKRLSNKMKKAVIYSRDPWIFFVISVLYKRHCFFEVHQFRFNGSLQTFIYRALVKRAAKSENGHIVCISKSLMKQWEKQGIDSAKIFVAHDAVNINKFNVTISKAEARQQLGFEQNPSIVVYTGSLIPGKGVDVLVKCTNRLPYISFIIVGGEKEQIRKLSKLARYSNVVFVGHIPPTRIPIYQAAADILALPNAKGSVIDDVTSPMKLFEYMASGRPIVATDMPSLLEVLENKYNALISPAGDDYKLSENIKLLFKDPSIGELLAKNARQDLEKYSWDARVGYLSELFDDFH